MFDTIIALQDKGYAICSTMTDPNKRKELEAYVYKLGERNSMTEEDIAEVERVYSRYHCCVCSQLPPRVSDCDNELSEWWKQSSELILVITVKTPLQIMIFYSCVINKGDIIFISNGYFIWILVQQTNTY